MYARAHQSNCANVPDEKNNHISSFFFYLLIRSGSIICEVQSTFSMDDTDSRSASNVQATTDRINSNIRVNKNQLTTSKGQIDGDEAVTNIQTATGITS